MPPSNFVTTGQYRNLRACMVCSIVQTQQVRHATSHNQATFSYRGADSSCACPEICQRRMSKLRRHAPLSWAGWSDWGLHLPCVRRTDLYARADKVMGSKVAESRHVCQGHVRGESQRKCEWENRIFVNHGDFGGLLVDSGLKYRFG